MEAVTLTEAQRIAYATLEAIATQPDWEHIKDLVGRELDITDEVIDEAVKALNAADKPKAKVAGHGVFVVTHLHAGVFFNTAVFTDADKAKACKDEWQKENNSEQDWIDLQECQVIGEQPPSNIITIDVKQFIQDHFVGESEAVTAGIVAESEPTDNEMEQFKDQLEDRLSDWISKEWDNFTPEPSSREMQNKERRDMGITE